MPTYATENSNFVTTVEENVLRFTSRQIKRTKSTRKIYRNIGLPTVKKLKNVVSTNTI